MSLFGTGVDKLIQISQKHMKDQATLQKWCGTIAMGLSCAAFTGSVFFNKSIPSEQKEFLVSQELADGVINVGLFLFATDRAKNWAEKTVANGKIFPKEMKDRIESIKTAIGQDANLEKIKKELNSSEIKRVGEFHTGFKNTVSLLGSLAAASIITPIVRNVIASTFQNRKQDDVKPEVAKPRVFEGNVYVSDNLQANLMTPRKPLPPSYNAFRAKSSMSI